MAVYDMCKGGQEEICLNAKKPTPTDDSTDAECRHVVFRVERVGEPEPAGALLHRLKLRRRGLSRRRASAPWRSLSSHVPVVISSSEYVYEFLLNLMKA